MKVVRTVKVYSLENSSHGIEAWFKDYLSLLWDYGESSIYQIEV